MNETFEQRLMAVRARMQSACEKAGRDPESVKLLAVSKNHGPDAVRDAMNCGLSVFGENRVQEAQGKISMLPDDLVWHLIGHLQTNKAKVAVRLFQMIHSVDSLRLLEALGKAAVAPLPILLQVNVAGEAAKFGMKPEEALAVLEAANRMQHIEVRGLMTIPPFAEDPENTRVHFSALRVLRDELQEKTDTPLPELSMGMSHDLEVAIEEGSTWVRIGTDLFGRRDYSK